MDTNTIVVDLDGTLTIDASDVSYEHKPENQSVLGALARAKRFGYRITVATSRNMRTYQGDLEKIKQHTQPVIEQWLSNKSVEYDQLVVGKPWCGPEGFYVDDRNLHIEEFVFRFTGPYADQSVMALIFGDLSERQNIHRMARLFHMKGVVNINNGNQCILDNQISGADYYLIISPSVRADIFTPWYAILSKLSTFDGPKPVKIRAYHPGQDVRMPDHGEDLCWLINRDQWSQIEKTTAHLGDSYQALMDMAFGEVFPFLIPEL